MCYNLCVFSYLPIWVARFFSSSSQVYFHQNASLFVIEINKSERTFKKWVLLSYRLFSVGQNNASNSRTGICISYIIECLSSKLIQFMIHDVIKTSVSRHVKLKHVTLQHVTLTMNWSRSTNIGRPNILRYLSFCELTL